MILKEFSQSIDIFLSGELRFFAREFRCPFLPAGGGGWRVGCSLDNDIWRAKIDVIQIITNVCVK